MGLGRGGWHVCGIARGGRLGARKLCECNRVAVGLVRGGWRVCRRRQEGLSRVPGVRLYRRERGGTCVAGC